MIDASLLTHEEKNYIDDYHSRVWDTISPYLDQPKDSAALDWLRYGKRVYFFSCVSLFFMCSGLFWHIFLIPQMQHSPLFGQGAHARRRKAPQERSTETALFPVLVIRLVSWTERSPKIKGGP